MKRILLLVYIMLLIFGAQASVCVRLDVSAALLDESGSVIVPLETYQDIIALDEGLFAACADGKWALMGEDGALRTPALYSDLRIAGATVAACRDEAWGLLDRNGGELSAFHYTRIIWDESGNFWALKTNPADMDSDELYLLDGDGSEWKTGLMVRRTGAAAQGRLAVQLPGSGLWGYCDAQGKLVIAAQYASAGAFVSGCAPVVQGGRFGAIDLNGRLIVPAQYDALEISPAGVILATVTGQGVQVFSPDGVEIAAYRGVETFAFLAGDGYGVVDAETRLYDAAGELLLTASGRASISEGLKGQFIIADGAWGENCVYLAGTENRHQNLVPLGMAGDRALYACLQVNASRYMNDQLGEMQLAVDMDSARYGVTDEQGNILIPAEYESVQYLGSGRLLLYADGLWQMADSAGNIHWSHGVRRTEESSF